MAAWIKNRVKFGHPGRIIGAPAAVMTDLVEKHTVSMAFVVAAVARMTPAARERALASAGIPVHLLEAPTARVPATSYSALWLAVARELDDEFFALDRRAMKVGSFALLCQAVLPCSDLDRAIRRILRGLALFMDESRAELTLDGGSAVISITNTIANADARRFADETLLTLIHGLMCWLAGRRIPLQQVAFAHRRPEYAREYTLMYCQDVKFGTPHSCMRFDSKALAAPVVQTATALQQFLRTAPQSVFLKYRNEDSWSAQIRRRLRDCIGVPDSWPTLDDLAFEFGLAAPTLRRRLDSEGTSYQGIKDQLRNDVAIDLLCNSSLSLDEVAAALGFQDASAFHRAFKRWNALQPGEYRRRQLQGAGEVS